MSWRSSLLIFRVATWTGLSRNESRGRRSGASRARNCESSGRTVEQRCRVRFHQPLPVLSRPGENANGIVVVFAGLLPPFHDDRRRVLYELPLDGGVVRILVQFREALVALKPTSALLKREPVCQLRAMRRHS